MAGEVERIRQQSRNMLEAWRSEIVKLIEEMPEHEYRVRTGWQIVEAIDHLIERDQTPSRPSKTVAMRLRDDGQWDLEIDGLRFVGSPAPLREIP